MSAATSRTLPSLACGVVRGRGTGQRGGQGRNEEKGAARSPEGGGPPHALATRSQGIHSLCSSSLRRRLGCFARGRAVGSSGFHPQAAWPRREVHQCGRCDSAGSRRLLALHAEAPDRRGRGTRLTSPARERRSPGSSDARSPCLRRRPPRNSLAGLATQGVAETYGVPTLPLRDKAQCRDRSESRKRRCFFGLRHFMWALC